MSIRNLALPLCLSLAVLASPSPIPDDGVAHAADAGVVADAPPVAATPSPAPTPDDPGSFFKSAYDLFHSKEWLPLTGLLVLGLAWLTRKLPVDWLKTGRGGVFAALFAGFAFELGTGMFAGKAPSLSAVMAALVAALVASGIFSQAKGAAKTPAAAGT